MRAYQSPDRTRWCDRVCPTCVAVPGNVKDDVMSRINTNIPALRAIRMLGRNQTDLNLRLERLSSGLQINRGRDDPAGLIASERLRFEMRGLQQAIENSSRANNVIATAEGALNETSALLLDLQSLVVSSANEAGLSVAEVNANQLQIDSILSSIDRIANNTAFAGRKLLDGSQGYHLSSISTAAFSQVSVFSARMPQAGGRVVGVKVTQSAQTAGISFSGTNTTGTSTTSASTIELRGTLGSELISFGSGTTLSEIAAAVNTFTVTTGVSAVVSAVGVGIAASALLLNSTTFGSDAFVSIEPIGGNFISSANALNEVRDVGQDAGVLIDGQPTSVRGLVADVRAGGLDARLYLTPLFGQTLSSASFNITGGGAVFQITPEINPNGQIFVGLNSVRTTQLGTRAGGLLYSLRSGLANDLASKNFSRAQAIVTEAISQVASHRGRLGNIQRNEIDPAINAQSITLENVTASESLIRDADMAVEISALTRAQILVQSTQRALQIANSIPNLVLSLLG